MPRPVRRPRLVVTIAVCLMLLLAVGKAVWQVRETVLGTREQLSSFRRSFLATDPTPADPTPADPAPAGVAPTDAPFSPGPSAAGPARSTMESVGEVCTQAQELDRGLGWLTEVRSAGGPAAQLLGGLPQVGERSAGLLVLVSASGDVLSAVRDVCEALEPMLRAGDKGASPGSALMVLGASREHLRAATQRLRSAQAQLAAVDSQALDDSTRALYGALRKHLPALTARLALLAELPALLGYDGPRTYLVLGQNSEELRPTGGFIGTAGVLTFDRGSLVKRWYGSSVFLNSPPDLLVTPPEPLGRYMDAAYWRLWEANWWPDYPSSARQARYFFDLVRDQPLAGVIAIDQEFVGLLLEITGPIELPEYGEVVTAANVRERMDYYTHFVSARDEGTRKGFISSLFSVLVERLGTESELRYRELALMFDRALRDQHILVWAEDERNQQALAALGWDGRMLSTPGDYLFPVSANLSANKINREVEQDVGYEVRQEGDGRLVARARLRLRNKRPTADPGPYRTADYRDFLRVFVPAGSEPVSAEGFDAEAEFGHECGRAVFSGLVIVPPGQERRIELNYRLPAGLRSSTYSLLVQKQPGVPAYPVSVRFVAAAGAESTAELSGHRLFELAATQLVSSPWTSAPGLAGAGPACQVYTEPPRRLRPPARLEIPALAVSAEVVDLGVEPDGTLASPKTGDVVGWYTQTARPGQVGNMIVSGHLDWNRRPAVFWGLRRLGPGDQIRVVDAEGASYDYLVEWTRRVDARKAPLDEILGPTTSRWLTLITCAGAFDPKTRDYAERLIVRAKLVTGS